MKKTFQNIIVLLVLCTSWNTTHATALQSPPAWAKQVVWYQIFVERFCNGDTTNDPKPIHTTVENMRIIPPENWNVTSWTSDWFKRDVWMKDSSKSFADLLQYRRYGGDLQGVLDKLDYLSELGITAIYLNPINDAPSLHKYDARNYHHVDVNFGPDPEGDLRIIASENPADPTTWQWTSADKLFLKLIDEAHKRNIRLVLDYSWNHTGTNFWAWLDILKNQANSAFKSWYNIRSFDDPATPENEFKYDGWYGNAYMPEFRKTAIEGVRENGKPYTGNIDDGAKKHIFDVTRRWLAPNGDTTKGIDGYRLDVAEQIGLNFWRDYRLFVRSVKADAYLIGEIWWEKWPHKLMDPVPYMQGDMFDAVMYYQVYKPARYFFAKTNTIYSAAQFTEALTQEWSKITPENVKAMMNVSSSHDAPRLLTDFFNPGNYKYHANPAEDPAYKTGKPDAETYKRLRLYLIHLFTTVGAPHIWNGEEMGMWGADDPYGRKPLWWNDLKFQSENRNNILPIKPEYESVGFNQKQFDLYQMLIQIRKNNPVLVDGDFKVSITQGKVLGYERVLGQQKISVILNADSVSQKIHIQKGCYLNLLTGKKINGSSLKLKALDGVVLKQIIN